MTPKMRSHTIAKSFKQKVSPSAILLFALSVSPLAHALTAQTITGFAPATPIPYSTGATFVLSAVGGASGNPVTFTSSTASVCTVAGSIVSVRTAGTCKLSAHQTGNATYQAAPTVNASVVIDKISQTLSFGPLPGQTFGTPPFNLTASASSGLTVKFSTTTATVCTVRGNTVTLKSAGTCSIVANQAGNTYTSAASPVTQSFAVAPANQVINFVAPASKTFGAAPFRLSAKASSKLAVAFNSTTPAVCTVTGATVTLLGAGTCGISANQAGNGNYQAAPQVNQSFAVRLSNQTITFAALPAKTYGDAPFTVAASASSGLPVTFGSTTPTVCTVAGSSVTILSGGKCRIAANQGGNNNYKAVTQVTRAFTVTKAGQTINFVAPADQNLGVAPFTPSATASSGLIVTFKSNTNPVCTVAGSMVTLLKTGTCTLIARQSGNTNYSAAPQITRSFVVAAALIPQAITGFAPATPISYSIGRTFTLSATGGASGNPVVFASATAGVCTVAGSTVSVLGAGTCTLTANQAGNAIYAAAPQVTANVLVTPGIQTISFDALTNQRIGAEPFSISASASSGLPVSFDSSTPTVCTVAGNTVTLAALGTCTLAANQPGNTSFNAAPPVKQTFLVGQAAITIAVGYAHACALTNAGGVQCWGSNAYGQLGDGSTTSRTSPVDVSGLASGVSAIEAGNAHTCAITAAGGAKCWGNNDAGQLGDGTLNQSSIPHDVAGLASNVVALTVGSQHTCALLGNGAVQCWGNNTDGQLGDGTGLQRLTPVSVQGLSAGVVDVRAGDNHTCAITNTGATQCWGKNAAGQLGNGTASPAFSPVNVSGLDSGVVWVEGAARHSCALTGLGGVKCWGDNTDGQLGNGGTAASLTPIDVSGLSSGIAAVAARGASSCALTPAGVALCWGANNTATTPQNIAGLAGGINEIGIGNGYYCALTKSSAMLCWGSNTTGQLGDGTTASRTTPAYVTGLTGGNATNQTITFGALPNKTPADQPFTLSASASSGLAVSFTSITPSVCTVVGGTVTLATVGNCTIAANQAGNSSVNAAQQVTRSFAVQPGTQGITGFAPGSPVAYSPGLTVVLSATGGASGNPVIFASTTSGVCTVTNSLMSVVAAGTCNLTANQAGNANYSAAPQASATVVISPISQTITFAAPSARKLSDTVFSVSASASSGLTVTFTSITPTVCTTANSNVTLVTVGTCTIAADQPGNGGTSAAPQVTQSFEVTQGTQAITDFAPPTPITYSPGQTFSLAATGGASSNGVVFASVTPTICTVANSTATVQSAGLCTLSADQAGDANYSAAPQVTASVVIEQVGQSIVFNELSDRTLGDASFALTASATSNLAVSFSSVTPTVCTVVGNTVTLVAPGTCMIESTQMGNDNTSAATQVTQSFMVGPAGQSIVFAVLPDRKMGDAPGILSATATSNLAVSFTSMTAAICTVTDTTVTLVAPGTCTIAADQAGDNRYGAAAQVTQSFTVNPAGVQVYYIHSDHLDTPRVITDAQGNKVWQWDNSDPYGNNAPNENPNNQGTFNFNLRFAGQYFDKETGLHQNYFRDYDPQNGRYLQSDLIGLDGGINTYAYVRGSPISYVDPLGLDATNWLNIKGGRASGYGPTNGNWGGGCWSGGQYSCGIKGTGNAPPTDSADACYMAHDKCYDDSPSCSSTDSAGSKKAINACNLKLVQCLQKLPNDSKQWPNPPKPGTEGDSERYRWAAILKFK